MVVLAPSLALTSAGASPTPAARVAQSVCRHAAYTGGGYFSQGLFCWEPGDTCTIVHWCSSRNVITSKDVTYTTSIPSTLDPRLTESDQSTSDGAVLKVVVNGGYDSGVLNNSGDIDLAGRVSTDEHHHFSDFSAAEG